jgi:hypothetical protein
LSNTVSVNDGLVYLELHTTVQFPRELIVDPRDNIDVSALVAGRPLVFAPGPETALSVGGDSLVPWQALDSLTVTCPNLGARRDVRPAVDVTGLTAIAAFTTEIAPVPVQASLGDDLWVLQRRFTDASNVQSLHYIAALHRADVDQAPGMTADATGTFAPLAESVLTMDLRLSQFATVAGVTAADVHGRVALEYQPLGLPRGFGTELDSRDLATFDLAKVLQDGALALSYGNPFPSSWPTYVELSTSSTQVDLALPGTPPFKLSGGLSVEMPLADAQRAPIVPMVGPVRDLRIDGMPVAQATQVSETATLDWQPPTVGTVAGYTVEVYSLTASSGPTPFTLFDQVARLYTAQPTVQLVPGLLSTGKTYFYQVTALAGGIDVLAAPHLVTGPLGASRTLSAKFTR